MKKSLVLIVIVVYLSLIHPFIASAIEPARREITTGKAKGVAYGKNFNIQNLPARK